MLVGRTGNEHEPRATTLRASPLIYRFLTLSLSLSLFACSSEILRQQEELIREQQGEILKQEKQIEELKSAMKREEQKRQDCNRAFGDFEQGQTARDPREAVELYRRGLGLCPDDDVAHYELGRILAGMGRMEEAAREFEIAVELNPNLRAAREQLKTLRRQ